jgi:hypothetical protein
MAATMDLIGELNGATYYEVVGSSAYDGLLLEERRLMPLGDKWQIRRYLDVPTVEVQSLIAAGESQPLAKLLEAAASVTGFVPVTAVDVLNDADRRIVIVLRTYKKLVRENA